jgi:hypothetical protein
MAGLSNGNSRLSMDALERAVSAVDPSAALVPPWLVRKVLLVENASARAIFATPRVPAHIVSRQRLLEIAQAEELPLEKTPPDATRLVLLARPDADELLNQEGGDLLQRYWRLLFHVRVRDAAHRTLDAIPDTRAAVQHRIERLGRAVFTEIRFVLVRERYLGPGAGDAEHWTHFAAVYLELTHFAPHLREVYFPSIKDHAAVVAQLGEELDHDSIFRTTRPHGAPDPDYRPHQRDDSGATARRSRRRDGDAARADRLLALAERADNVGNDVRGAILRMRVYQSGAPNTGPIYTRALNDLDDLVTRLKTALALEEPVARQWRAWLQTLLENAAGGWWSAERRLLYDLQKVCVYHEREIYSVNVIDWLLEFGRRPLKRPQPGQRLVLIVKSLRSALRRLDRARISAAGRGEMHRLLEMAIHHAEQRLREFLRPGLLAALEQGELVPATATEHVAFEKLVEELLDDVVHKGYLTAGSVRDAVSRSQMKLNDLTQARDFTSGDQLLRIDRKLEDNLDYVYHRAEIYLRGFYRMSSWFFATAIGRFITRMVILPFGGAFLILEALDHSVGKLIHKVSSGPTSHAVFSRWWLVILVGMFLLGLINFAPFRRFVAEVFSQFFRVLGVIFVDLPKWIATRPLVQAVFSSRLARAVGRYGVKPLLFAWLAYTLVPDRATRLAHMVTVIIAYVIVNLLLNSPTGRALEQAVLHSVRVTIARITWEIILSIFRGVMNLFEAFLEFIDRILYAVDDLLRFRAGQGRFAVISKAILGIFWFYITYITRFVINLLVEPQINPIKHFPVVTVSHKMILPLAFPLADALKKVGIESGRAAGMAGAIVTATPGIFGFLAWEFKENWKLYKANASRNLKPVRVGSHGETLASFLRPGFHSGTIPKIYHRLRRASAPGRSLVSAEKQYHAAEHVREEIAAFVRREFIALLTRDPRFADAPFALAAVELGVTSIRISLQRFGLATIIRFDQSSGWIVARIEHAGFIDALSADQRQLFAVALLGLYKLSGVDVIAEHLEATLKTGTHLVSPLHAETKMGSYPISVRFDLRRDRLIVWPTDDYSIEAVYEFTDQLMPPRGANGASLPPLRLQDIFFRYRQVPRASWSRLWELGPTSQTTLQHASPDTLMPTELVPPLPQLCVLPPSLPHAEQLLHRCDEQLSVGGADRSGDR